MVHFTREELREMEDRIDRACYDALWGYDGLGGYGPKVSFERWQRETSYTPKLLTNEPHKGSLERARHHRKGNGWKANHEGNV